MRRVVLASFAGGLFVVVIVGCAVHHQQQSTKRALPLSLAPTEQTARPSAERSTTTTPAPFPTSIVELRGTGAQIGAEHGRELAGPIQILFAKYLRPYFRSETQRTIALTMAQAFEMLLAPAHRDEVKALARQVGLDERE